MAAAGSRAGIVLRWFIASRLAIALIGVIGVATFANVKFAEGVRDAQHTSAVVDNVSALNPQTVWHKWDSPWYEGIAVHGYASEPGDIKGQAAAAYFPLYPAIVGAILKIAPSVSFFPVAAVLSNLFTLAALLLLASQLTRTADMASRVMAIMMTSAGSFYLSIPYAESLFLLLVVSTLVATRRGYYEIAGLLAGLSGTTRAHGWALVAVPAVACWLDTRLATRVRVARALGTVVLFAVPILIYLAYLAQVQGSWTAFLTRQSMWQNPSPYPFQAIVGLFEYPRRIGGWLHGATWFLYVGLLVRYWRRLPLGEALFCAGALLISTQQDMFQGIYRYVVPLVPLTLALADDRDDIRRNLIAFNLVLAVLMILAFVTENRITV
jgi:Gpi18-like mannosyltransferase